MRCIIHFILYFIFCVITISCNQHEKSYKYDHLDQRTKIRLKQYLVEGKRLYSLHCANCHQPDGAGLAKLYPPLKKSDYLISNRNESICGMRHGQKGEIFVNGISFNQEMPGVLNLTDLEIAEIATYIYNEFADTVQIITLNEVRAIMKLCIQESMNKKEKTN